MMIFLHQLICLEYPLSGKNKKPNLKVRVMFSRKCLDEIKYELFINGALSFSLGDVYAIFKAVLALLGSLSGGFPSVASEILG